jgi:hypothetical protein
MAAHGQDETLNDPAAEFVEIDAQIELLTWNNGLEEPRSQAFPVHVVTGRNKWMIADQLGKTNYYTYDGTNLVENRWTDTDLSEPQEKPKSSGRWWTWSFQSLDGNPTRTVRASDRMDMLSRIAWYALCSARTLNNPDHKLYPPWELWKEYLDPSRFVEKTKRLEDDLGLPRSLVVFSGEQPVVDIGSQLRRMRSAGFFHKLFICSNTIRPVQRRVGS